MTITPRSPSASGSLCLHRVGGQAQHVECADQVHLDHPAKGIQRTDPSRPRMRSTCMHPGTDDRAADRTKAILGGRSCAAEGPFRRSRRRGRKGTRSAAIVRRATAPAAAVGDNAASGPRRPVAARTPRRAPSFRRQ